jgi:creatinine amidohydrolase
MSWPEVEARLKETDVALVPTGSNEQHGPILPEKTDIFIATEIARRAAEDVSRDVKAVVAPPVPFGYSPEWLEWPGTISLRIETLRNLLMDVVTSLTHQGFKKIVLVNGHGSNPPILWQIMTEMNREPDVMLLTLSWWELIMDEYEKVIEKKGGMHADELETSLIMALGEQVDMSKAEKTSLSNVFPDFQSPSYSTLFSQSVYFWRTGHVRAGMPSGVMGDPTKSSKEKGQKILNAAVTRLAKLLRELDQKQPEDVRGL